jgi:hypothetical protein
MSDRTANFTFNQETKQKNIKSNKI